MAFAVYHCEQTLHTDIKPEIAILDASPESPGMRPPREWGQAASTVPSRGHLQAQPERVHLSQWQLEGVQMALKKN